MNIFLNTTTAQCLLSVACLFSVMATQVNAEDQDMTTKVNGVISQMRSGLIMVTAEMRCAPDRRRIQPRERRT